MLLSFVIPRLEGDAAIETFRCAPCGAETV